MNENVKVDTIVELITKREDQLKGKNPPAEEINSFLKDFANIGKEIKEKSGSEIVREDFYTFNNFIFSYVTVGKNGIELCYTPKYGKIIVSEMDGNDKKTLDIIRYQDGEFISSLYDEILTPTKAINYFEHTQVYRDLDYLSKK